MGPIKSGTSAEETATMALKRPWVEADLLLVIDVQNDPCHGYAPDVPRGRRGDCRRQPDGATRSPSASASSWRTRLRAAGGHRRFATGRHGIRCAGCEVQRLVESGGDAFHGVPAPRGYACQAVSAAVRSKPRSWTKLPNSSCVMRANPERRDMCSRTADTISATVCPFADQPRTERL